MILATLSLATGLGLSEEEFLKMLINPLNVAGSNLYLMEQNLLKQLNNSKNKL